MKKETYYTNYGVAVNWLNNNLVLCNNVPSVDSTIWDNARFDLADEKGTEKEIFQWYITDCTQDDVKYLEETFGLLFTYSELLDCFILCVDHYGTNWYWVTCETTNKYAARELGEKKDRSINK